MCLQSSEVHGSGRWARLLQVEQGLQVAPEDSLLLLLAEALEPLHPGDGRRMPGDEGPVAAQHHAVRAHLVEEEAEGLLAACDGVVVEAALIGAGRLRDAAGLPAALAPPSEPAPGGGRRGAGRGGAHPEMPTSHPRTT